MPIPSSNRPSCTSMPVAVDAMGGDSPLSIQLEGAVRAANELGIEVVLVGHETQIKDRLNNMPHSAKKVRVVHCEEMVEMHESPSQALRQKKDSSIRVAMDLHKRGEVDAVVSAGNTGAAMATAKFVLKSIPKITKKIIMESPDKLRQNQSEFSKTGGIHASGLFTDQGDIVAIKEDVGRHNALDKLIGHGLDQKLLNPNTQFLTCSGRLNFDLVQKLSLIHI